MTGIVQDLSANLKDIPMTTYREVKELLNDPSWKYIHRSPNSSESGEIQVEIDIGIDSPEPYATDVLTIVGTNDVTKLLVV